MKHNTPNKAKFKKLQRRLGTSLAETIGHLELLWRATIENAPQGDIGKLDNETIAIECDYQGDPDEFVRQLVSCGWLDESPRYRLLVHDWADHCPAFVKGNLKNQKREFATDPGCGTIVQDPGCGTIEGTQGPPLPSQVKSDQAKPSQAKSNSCPEPLATDPPPAMVFCVKGNPPEWGLPQSKLDEWIETYVGLDVRAELAKANQWQRDNPAKRKTARGMTAFLGRWLNRANDKPRSVENGDDGFEAKMRAVGELIEQSQRERGTG